MKTIIAVLIVFIAIIGIVNANDSSISIKDSISRQVGVDSVDITVANDNVLVFIIKFQPDASVSDLNRSIQAAIKAFATHTEYKGRMDIGINPGIDDYQVEKMYSISMEDAVANSDNLTYISQIQLRDWSHGTTTAPAPSYTLPAEVEKLIKDRQKELDICYGGWKHM
jgi:hypothetical protein